MSTHHRQHRLALVIAALALAAACAAQEPPAAQSIEPLVTTEWLARHLGDPDLVVLDCTVRVEREEDGSLRTVSGRADYEGGHIPTAGFADLMADLADPDSALHFAVPTPERFAAAMGALGVGDDSRVVLYDQRYSAWAARVWWMLRWVGFDRAAILDGGLTAWTAEERPLSTEPSDRPAARLTVALRPQLIAHRDEVRTAVQSAAVHLIDAMPEPHFRGEMAMYARPGHIPGAVNIPATSLLDETGHYRPLDELATLHDSDREARYITYCGGGISASSNAFVMARLGFTDVAVYTASLQEWAADPDNPLVTGTP